MAGHESERRNDVPPPLNHTSENRKSLREQMANQVEAYLEAGGQVEVVERGKRSDQPRKPNNRYGSRPI